MHVVLISTRRHAKQLLGQLRSRPGRQVGIFATCLGSALGVFALSGLSSSLTQAPRRALFILVLAATLWVSEAIPAFAVSILVIALGVMLLGKPDGVFARGANDWTAFVEVLGHPLIWLFFGSFALASAASITRLDQQLARRVLHISGTKPYVVFASTMALTFVLSMFVSNTATTAMMLTMLAPLVRKQETSQRLRQGLLLGICFAANLGGMGTLVGTPPNAIAVGLLADVPGANISFAEWFAIGLPPATFGLVVVYFLVIRRFVSPTETLSTNSGSEEETGENASVSSWKRVLTAGTFAITIGLWMTGSFHGMPTAAVSFLPIVVFTATGILKAPDIRNLPWDVLLLIAGGLSLGFAISATGLASWLIEVLSLRSLSPLVLAPILALLSVVLSNVMSNTAATNVLVPLAIALAPGAEMMLAIPVALSASAACCLPISTPPNAIAYSYGAIEAKEMLRLGLIVGLVVPLFAVPWSMLLLPWLGS